MERRRYRQQHSALGAHLLGELDRPLDRRARARNDNLRGIVVVGDGADVLSFGPLDGGSGNLARLVDIGTEQGGHRALADGNRRLHRAPAQFEEARGRRQIDRARRAQCGIFAEAVTGDAIARFG